MPWLRVKLWILKMVESSSAEEEDRELERRNANEEISSLCLQDSPLYSLS
jgi:hypothetical protein